MYLIIVTIYDIYVSLLLYIIWTYVCYSGLKTAHVGLDSLQMRLPEDLAQKAFEKLAACQPRCARPYRHHPIIQDVVQHVRK